MRKGTMVVYMGGSDVDSLTVGQAYEVLDYSDWRGQVKIEDNDGDTIWVSDACVKE